MKAFRELTTDSTYPLNADFRDRAETFLERRKELTKKK